MNRLFSFFLALAPIVFAPAADAAKRKLSAESFSTEDALLRYLVDQPDLSKKVPLMEDFVAKYPSHISATWIWGELQEIYRATNQYDKAIAAGEKVLAADPEDIGIAHGNLKAAEAAKDPDLIWKWAIAASKTARRVIGSPAPANAEELASWQNSVAYAKQVEATCDYTLYTLALQAAPHARRIALTEALAQHSPASPYNALLRPQLFFAYQQTGSHARALQMAEEDYRLGNNNEDMLLYAATRAYEKQDKVRVTQYSKRLLETFPGKPAPEGVTPADWARNKHVKLGIAQWMLGVMASKEQRWPDADLHLRAALPNVGQNKDIHAETLYHLGLANYKLGEARNDTKRLTDAVKFNQQCAAIPSSFQAQAKMNVASIRSQFHLQ